MPTPPLNEVFQKNPPAMKSRERRMERIESAFHHAQDMLNSAESLFEDIDNWQEEIDNLEAQLHSGLEPDEIEGEEDQDQYRAGVAHEMGGAHQEIKKLKQEQKKQLANALKKFDQVIQLLNMEKQEIQKALGEMK